MSSWIIGALALAGGIFIGWLLAKGRTAAELAVLRQEAEAGANAKDELAKLRDQFLAVQHESGVFRAQTAERSSAMETQLRQAREQLQACDADLRQRLARLSEVEKEASAYRVKSEEASAQVARLDEQARKAAAELGQRTEDYRKATEAAAAHDAHARTLAAQLAQARDELLQRTQDLKKVSETCATTEADRSNLQKRLAEERQQLELLQARMESHFKVLAQSILEEKSKVFTEQNRSNLEVVLNPLKEQIKTFETRVNTINDKQTESHAALLTQIQNLTQLNNQVTAETHNLTKALKGESKVQGDWGEMILERILEDSGLIKDTHYVLQENHKDDEGKDLRPDAIVKLPNDRRIIVDSKVSLKAFDRLVAAQSEGERQDALDALATSFRAHAIGLAQKNYPQLKGMNAPECVLMFVPIEATLSAVTIHDRKLFSDLFALRIVLVSPASLMATLRTIEYIWKQDDQRRNREEIIKQASLILDSIRQVEESFDSVANYFGKAQESMQAAQRHLKSGGRSLEERSKKLLALGVPEKSTAKKARKLTADDPARSDDANGDEDPAPGDAKTPVP